MKKYFITCFCILFFINGRAQDTIVTQKQDNIVAKIIGINRPTVKYQLFDKMNDSIYKINISDIKLIKYKNGNVAYMKWHGHTPVFSRPQKPTQINPNANIVSAGYWVFGDYKTIQAIYISYEKMLLKNILNLSFTPQIGINTKSFGTSIGVKACPNPGRRANLLLGTELLIWAEDEGYYDPNKGQGSTSLYVLHQTTKLALMGDVGLRIHGIKNSVFMINLGLGHVINDSYEKKNKNSDVPLITEASSFKNILLKAGIGIGWRF